MFQTDAKRLTKTSRRKNWRKFSPPAFFFPVGEVGLEQKHHPKRQQAIAGAGAKVDFGGFGDLADGSRNFAEFLAKCHVFEDF